MGAFGVICFGLVGLELASVMGDEIQDPRRTLPGAVALGGLICGLFYIGATLTLLLALPKNQIGVLRGNHAGRQPHGGPGGGRLDHFAICFGVERLDCWDRVRLVVRFSADSRSSPDWIRICRKGSASCIRAMLHLTWR